MRSAPLGLLVLAPFLHADDPAFVRQQALVGAVQGIPRVAAADFDGDGDVDLLQSTFWHVHWFENVSCASGGAALEVVRLGAPANPAALLPGVTSGPVVCATWDPQIDHAGFAPGSILDLLVVTPAPANLPTVWGTLLCDTSVAPVFFQAAPGSAFQVPIPVECTWVGKTVCAQGASVDPALGLVLTNALDVTVGSY